MSADKKFGTFSGVYTPSLLTILGVIMYMRLGMVVGNASGLAMVLGIVLCAHLVSVTTGLSVSSIATDKKIKAGGIYYMLSRSLGFPIGGAIGLTLFVGTALSIALYLVGFSESFLQVLGWNEIQKADIQLTGSIALLAIVVVAFISTSIAIKAQYFILGAIVLSLVSIFAGSPEGLKIGKEIPATGGFGVLFGIFFPAVTGFTAGVAMSGDLRDPKTSIPWGTMLAIFTGLAVYLGLALFLFFTVESGILATNYNVLVEMSWIPELVIAGIWGATLSSAIGGILGAPRILQAMSNDQITPRLFGVGVGKSNEPRNALIATAIIAELGILIGELELIAEVVAMFYMAAYMFINISCFLEQIASPDFRPKFKIAKIFPALGAITTIILMIQLNLPAAIVAVLLMALLFIWLTRKQLVLGTGDIWQSVWSWLVKFSLNKLNNQTVHSRNWKPNVLLFSGGTSARPHLIEFSKNVTGSAGVVSNFDLIETPDAEVLFPKHKQSIIADDLKDDSIFHRRQECQNVFKGIEAIASTYGFAGVEPNTVLMGWPRNTKDPLWFSQMTRKLHVLDYNVLYLDYDKEKGFGKYERIDIWWKGFNDEANLSLQMAKLLQNSDDWSNCNIRVLYLNQEQIKRSVLEEAISSRIQELRLDIDFLVINNELENKDFFEIIRIHSYEADLIMIDIPEPGNVGSRNFVARTNEFLEVMGTTLLLKASSQFSEVSDYNPILENKFVKPIKTLAPGVISESIELGQCLDKKLNSELIKIDAAIQEAALTFTEEVFQKVDDIFSVFFDLITEKRKALDDDKFYESAYKLLDDLNDKRLPFIAASLNKGLNNHIYGINAYIENCPDYMQRVYAPGEVLIHDGDSDEIIKLKRKFQRKPYARIYFKKVLIHHFEQDYLFYIKDYLNRLGVCTYLINVDMSDWLAENTADNLKVMYQERITQQRKAFLQAMHRLGRKYCNAVLADIDKLNINDVSIYREEEKSSGVLKKAFAEMSSYPDNWLVNQRLISNQLKTKIQLIRLKISLLPVLQNTNALMNSVYLNSVKNGFESIKSAIGQLTPEKIDVIEGNLIQLANSIKIDDLLRSDMNLFDEYLNKFCFEQEVLSPESSNEFEQNQLALRSVNINVKRVAGYLLENEIVARLKEILHQSYTESRSDIMKVENAIRLIKFTLLGHEENPENLKEVRERSRAELSQCIDRVERIMLKLNSEISIIEAKLSEIMSEEVLITRAARMDGIIKIVDPKKGYAKYAGKLKKYYEATGSFVDQMVIKTKDALTKSGYRYRTKALINPHSKWSDFYESISLSPRVELPFYYRQLFSGKQLAPDVPLENRKKELNQFNLLYQRFNRGKSGAILFIGEPLSGKTYLMNNAAKVSGNNLVRVAGPVYRTENNIRLIDAAFMNAAGKKGAAESILSALPDGTIVLMEDLELWWTRSENGLAIFNEILRLVKMFSQKHLFMLDCSVHFYQMVKYISEIDLLLLGTINVSPLGIEEIKRLILTRHNSGGMTFSYKGIREDQMKPKLLNQIFKKVASASEGNIGSAFHLWLGLVIKIEKNNLSLEIEYSMDLPDVFNEDWDLILTQLLVHKVIDFERLCEIYINHSKAYVNDILQSLCRTGIVETEGGDFFKISPFAVIHVAKYLRKKQLLA